MIRQEKTELFITPDNAVIVFDIHGVLFRPDYKGIIKIFLASPYKYRCIRYALYPSTWIDFIRLYYNNVIFGKYVAHFTKKYPRLKPCVPLITRIANTQVPIAQTIALIEQLHADGYTLHILSNIGQPIVQDLAQKFPAIFDYFETIKTPCAQIDFTGKPNPAIFYDYMKENNLANKQVIFIDDKMKNLEVAQRFGITGIYFSNPEELKQDLMRLGVIAH